MAEGFSTKTSDLVRQRDAGRCVSCGGRAEDKHHRRRRRENGDGLAHLASNGVLLCGKGNVTGCHGRAHKSATWAREKGYVVRPGVDPTTVSIWHYSRGWITLDNDGGWTVAEDGVTRWNRSPSGS